MFQTLQKRSVNLIVILIAIGAFSLGMSSYITAGLMPYIQQDFNVSIAWVAQLVTIFTVAYGLGSPIVIASLPKNKQRIALLLALLVFALSNFISGLTDQFSTLLWSRAFAGVGAGVYLAIGIMIATSLVQPHLRAKAISWIMSGMAAGTVLGVPLGLILSDQYGWQISMYLIALLGSLSLVGLLMILPKNIQLESQSWVDKVKLFKDISIIRILSVSLLAAVSSLGLYTYLFPILNSNDFGEVQNITPFLWVWGLGGILGSLLIGHFSAFISNQKLTILILLILGIAMLAMPLLAWVHPWLVMIALALWGAMGWALQIPQNDELIRVREAKGGGDLAVALNESALYLGSAIGTVLGGFIIYYEISLIWLPVFASVIVFMALIFQIKKVNNLEH